MVDLLQTVPVTMMFALVSYFVVLITVPKYRDWIYSKGLKVIDVNKSTLTHVARPVSLPLLAGFLSSMVLLYVSFENLAILMLFAVAYFAFVIGFLDDVKTRKGWFKPVLLLGGGAIIFMFNTYHNSLIFPVIGLVEIPNWAYLILMVPIISLIANTVNSIDVVNGAASGSMTIAAFSLAFVLALMGEYQLAIITFPLGMVSYAFYKYHKVPASAFLGDSGTLFLGAIFAAIAIAGNAEVFAFIILAPMVLNSFLFLASVRKVVEHREIRNAAVVHDEQMRLTDSGLKGAPMTLVRLLVRKGAKTEQQIADRIITLVTISSAVAIILAWLT